MYSATKHAIQELSRGLRMEMVEKQTGIHVSVRNFEEKIIKKIIKLKFRERGVGL